MSFRVTSVPSSRLTSAYLGPFAADDADDIVALLFGNAVPNPMQTMCIRYRAEAIARQLDFMTECAAKLADEHQVYRSVLSPVRRVPMEILGEIFKLVVPSFLNSSDREMLGNLGSVCLGWRLATLSTPALWRGVILGPCICPDQGTVGAQRLHEEDYKKLVVWIGRSGGCPKGLIYSSVDLHCHCEDGSSCKAVHPLVTKFIKEGPTLDHLTLQLSGPSCFRNWLAAFGPGPGAPEPHPLEKLRSFSLEFVDDTPLWWNDGPDPSASVFNLLPSVPSLGVFLPLRDTAFEDEMDSLECPIHIPPRVLGPLVSLAIRWDWEGRRLIDVLGQCASLKTFTLDLARSEPFEDDDLSPPLELKSLSSFKLVKGGVRVLEFLRMPALVSLDLELNVDRRETEEISERLDRFLRASDLLASLTYLRICELTGGPGIVTLLLPPLSSLQHLVLDSSTACGYFFGQTGTCHRGGPPLRHFPALRHVELLNVKRSSLVLAHELQFFSRKGSAGKCALTISYAKEPKVSEAELQSRLKTVQAPGSQLSIQVVQPEDYDELRALTL
ncbi:hypothetical protein D9611_009556 [Ephemerocybe angulata]|uniref:F-box domain-containing protein n=1 Tax=Ephemerocybe angulata TaxID=980116 RepID=A0A8H5AV94_9AGAR|nr:hypothetical protein D9611_009556 [Tulosesus angulatus]